MWKCTGNCSVAARLPQRIPRAVGEVGAAEVLRVRRQVHAAQPEARARARASRTHASTSHAGRIAIGSSRSPDSACSSAFASLKISRQRVRSATSCTAVAERLAAEADDVREDDLRPDAGLVHQLQTGDGVVRGCVGLVDLPLVQPLERTALACRCLSTTPPAPARPRTRHRRRPTSPRRRPR